MRHSNTHSPSLRTDRKLSKALRECGKVFVVLLLVSSSTACVTGKTHRLVVDDLEATQAERLRLAARNELLEASNESLTAERIELVNSVEDLRLAREQLESERKNLTLEVNGLAKEREALQSELKARSAQLAKRENELSKLTGTYDSLIEELEDEVASGQIQIEQLREGLRLNLASEVLFPSGSADLGSAGTQMLQKVASQLQEANYVVTVQGHTDDVPISTARFPSNWELAAARATRVARLLEAEGVEPRRITGVSYGEYHPIADNETEEGRRRNRRIEIRLKPVSSELDPAEADPAEDNPGGADPNETEPTEVDPTEIEPAEVAATEIESTEEPAVEESTEVEPSEPISEQPAPAEAHAAGSE